MDNKMPARFFLFGIRGKLIALFVAIKVVPLLLLALLAWFGMKGLGSEVVERASGMAAEMRQSIHQAGKIMTDDSIRALDLRSREAIERLTTDTARALADFLYDRDKDMRLAANLDMSADSFRRFLSSRTRAVAEHGEWRLAADGKSWEPAEAADGVPGNVAARNAQNRQDWHYRPAEERGRGMERPLYLEMTLVGLDGREKIKVTADGTMPHDLRDVSRRENTWVRAEDYFRHLATLKPGELYVSNVVGAYAGSPVIGTYTPEKAKSLGIPFAPEKAAYAGKENPAGKRFRGIVRWATPVMRGGEKIGYLTLALDHRHVMNFTEQIVPTDERYSSIPDAASGNYAFIWDYLGRNIAHPRHHSIVGYDPQTGEPAVPWLEKGLYDAWRAGGLPLREFLAGTPPYEGQDRNKKPAAELTRQGLVGLDCRYLNFAPQCEGWHNLTEQGGSGSFVILWSGLWKLTTAATIPYYTGQYAHTPRGFGYVTIGANVEEFHKPALASKARIDEHVARQEAWMKSQQEEMDGAIFSALRATANELAASTAVMVVVVILIAIWLASLLTRRITLLVEGTRRFQSGDLAYRLPKGGNDEMGALADSMNVMADGVQESFRRLEEARDKAEEANRTKSEFLAGMSHELRTPLNGILGFSEIIRDEAQDEELRAYASGIHESGQQLSHVFNAILDMSRIEAGTVELNEEETGLQDIAARLAQVHEARAREKGLDFHVHLAADLPETIRCDAGRLMQVLDSLLDNAVKFTPQGHVDLRLARGEGGVRFAVADTGPGIAPDARDRLFEKFRQGDSFLTRSHGGIGLGLATAKALVEMMGGRISVDSVPGEGAEFYFLLPEHGVTAEQGGIGNG